MASGRSGASGSRVSTSERHAIPARGRGRLSSTSSLDLFIATATRSTPSPCGAAKTATSTPPSASFQADCVIGPSASRHSTSGRSVESNGSPGQECVARQGGVGAPDFGEPARERDQPGVGVRPVNCGRRVVLGVGVVVAALAEAELRAHRQHRRSARGEQQRQEIALIQRPRRDDGGIPGRPLDAVIPGDNWRRFRRGCARRSPRCASARRRRGRRE